MNQQISRRSPRRMLAIAAALIVLAASWALTATAQADIYWASYFTDHIARANDDGSGVDPSFITTGRVPRRVAVDDEHVYWTNYAEGTIGRARLDGSGVDQSFISTAASGPEGIAVDDEHIYWSNFGAGTISRANLDGSGVEQSFITGATRPRAVAASGDDLYWANEGTGTIGHARADGSSIDQSFITDLDRPADVEVQGAYVYWTEPYRGFGDTRYGSIGRANRLGAEVNRTFVRTGFEPLGLAVDGRHIYWTNWGEYGDPTYVFGTIGRAALDGSGGDQYFITGLRSPYEIETDPLKGLLPSSASLDFGARPPGSVSPVRTLTITNEASWSLHVGQIRTEGADADDFLVSSDSCSQATLASGQACAIGVRHAPGAAGPRSASLMVPSDNPDTPSVKLTGTGRAPAHSLTVARAGSGTGAVTSAPTGIDCGSSCSATFDEGATVTLAAVPEAGSAFAGWSGAGCTGIGECRLTLGSDATVVATFTQNASSPPETTITSSPPPKVKAKRRYAASFEFSSSGSGSSFACKLDAGAYAACASPFAAKLKPGRHTFSVRAADAHGNVDASPATDTIRVRRRRH